MAEARYTYDPGKLADVVMYILSRCPPARMGVVKLHKALYLSDMVRCVQSGAPMTGAVYRKRPFGPACENLADALRDLEARGAIAVGHDSYHGIQRKVFAPKIEDYRSNQISSEEASLVDDAIAFVFFDNVATVLSEFSHNRVWELVEMGQEMPYESALLIVPEDLSAEAFDWSADDLRTLEAPLVETLDHQ